MRCHLPLSASLVSLALCATAQAQITYTITVQNQGNVP